MTAVVYCSGGEIKSVAYEGLKNADASLLSALAEKASRIIDAAAELPSGYFQTVPAVPPTWAANKAYVQGALVVPTISDNRSYQAQTAGTSAATEPVWPQDESTLVDGTTSWAFFAEVASERIFYGLGVDLLSLPPYVPGTLASVALPNPYPAASYVEQGGGILRAYAEPIRLSLTDPTFWPQRNGYDRRAYAGWPEGVAVTVKARWGVLEVPADVRQATVEIAIWLFRQSDPALQQAAQLEGRASTPALPPTAQFVADKWKAKGLLYGS